MGVVTPTKMDRLCINGEKTSHHEPYSIGFSELQGKTELLDTSVVCMDHFQALQDFVEYTQFKEGFKNIHDLVSTAVPSVLPQNSREVLGASNKADPAQSMTPYLRGTSAAVRKISVPRVNYLIQQEF